MNEIILDVSVLPEPLHRLLKAEKVKVRELDGEILLTPIVKTDIGCPLLGITADCGFTVDDFLSRKHDEKELEGE